ncbi:ErfK/YbiS/YcfS/YnhG family protein [Ancylobacter novellus DSM 506]|uniref:ErfK/YbiS/YcfS/YnhG family protein n=1 Tax=Ancylobacter novellus (strain ATCC 8093 / DSM 506 / JCM 20403 / CCM 1077 / IAM 12100 / NBRC 12443 / NCIMB 10456) TaxID=639283 RepID=D7A881_ANCN5|nr:L,D-transpeptidase [Ancylobacter novellus]ADH88554.1 ErfK/YbiS/YcfS/YnhG family protein [Ancylobacter novellus DSM 506]
MQLRNDRQTLCGVSRRGVLLLLPLALAACATRRPQSAPAPAVSPFASRYAALEDGGFRVPGVPVGEMKERNRRALVDDPTGQLPGTLVVDPKNRFLYLVQENGKALRYGVGVGREGLEFSGTAEVAHKRAWPRWTPTPNMIAREPEKYEKWAGGMAGGESNPLGARALYLFKDGKDTLYRIHGTNEPWSIGEAVSSGCIRMMNQDVIDLYQRIPDGTKVVVLPAN